MPGNSRADVAAEGVLFPHRKEVGFVNVLSDIAAADADRGHIEEQFALSRHGFGHLHEADLSRAVINRCFHRSLIGLHHSGRLGTERPTLASGTRSLAHESRSFGGLHGVGSNGEPDGSQCRLGRVPPDCLQPDSFGC